MQESDEAEKNDVQMFQNYFFSIFHISKDLGPIVFDNFSSNNAIIFTRNNWSGVEGITWKNYKLTPLQFHFICYHRKICKFPGSNPRWGSKFFSDFLNWLFNFDFFHLKINNFYCNHTTPKPQIQKLLGNQILICKLQVIYI